MKKFLLLLFLGSIIVLCSYLLDYYFGPGSLIKWRIDNVLHVLGGIYAFFFVRSLYYLTEKCHKTTTAFLFEIIIFAGGALILGVLWEWYEFVFIYKYGTLAMSKISVTTYMDTIYDLMFDLVGALLAGLYLVIKNGKNK